MKINHIIFDCDGVLVDSEPLSMQADVSIVSRFGIPLSPEEAGRRFIGKTFEAMLEDLSKEFGVVFPEGLSEEKDRLLEDMFRTSLEIVPGVCAVLDALTAQGMTFSVASNSPLQRVELALELVGIRQHFQSVTTFEEVAKGKPAPDVYVRAVEKVGKTGNRCVVIEDSSTGVTAAVAAGLLTWGFTGTHHNPAAHAEALKRCGATQTFHTMETLLAKL